jgi:hypothetical protein
MMPGCGDAHARRRMRGAAIAGGLGMREIDVKGA